MGWRAKKWVSGKGAGAPRESFLAPVGGGGEICIASSQGGEWAGRELGASHWSRIRLRHRGLLGYRGRGRWPIPAVQRAAAFTLLVVTSHGNGTIGVDIVEVIPGSTSEP